MPLLVKILRMATTNYGIGGIGTLYGGIWAKRGQWVFTTTLKMVWPHTYLWGAQMTKLGSWLLNGSSTPHTWDECTWVMYLFTMHAHTHTHTLNHSLSLSHSHTFTHMHAHSMKTHTHTSTLLDKKCTPLYLEGTLYTRAYPWNAHAHTHTHIHILL